MIEKEGWGTASAPTVGNWDAEWSSEGQEVRQRLVVSISRTNQ